MAMALEISKSRSGTKWSEADYRAAGYQRINLRIKNADMLAEIADEWGCSRSDAIDQLIATEWHEQRCARKTFAKTTGYEKKKKRTSRTLR